MKSVAVVLAALLALPQDPPPSIEQLVERLRSEKPGERSDAERQLLLRTDDVLPAVGRVARDEDPEVAARARGILETVGLLRTMTGTFRKTMPEGVAKLASRIPHAWTEVFLDATQQDGLQRKHPELGREDFQPLALRALRNAEGAERVRVCGAIAAWRLDAAVPALGDLIQEQDWQQRQAVLEAITECGARSLLPVLLQKLRQEPTDSKSGWYPPLIRLGGREALPDLLSGLLSQKWHEQGQMLYLLAELDAPELIPAFLKGMREFGDPYCILLALASVAPEEILPSLMKAFEDEKEEVRGRARDMFSRWYRSAEAVPFLTRCLEHQDFKARSMAVHALGQIRVRAAIPAIRLLLDDDAVTVRRAAALVLAGFGVKDGIAELLLMLRQPETRLSAAYRLWTLGNREGVPLLLEMLSDPKAGAHVAGVLAQMGVAEVRPGILKMLETGDPNTRSSALWSLVVLDGPKAAPTLMKHIHDAEVGPQALRSLESFGNPEALPAVRQLVKKGTPDPTGAYHFYLSRFAPVESLPDVLRQAASTDPWIRASAPYQLARVGRAEAPARLRVLLTDPDGNVRRAAAEILTYLGEKDGLLKLMHRWIQTGNHCSLNQVRSPELCRTWTAKLLAGPAMTGSPRELAEQFTERTGIRIDWPTDGSDLTNFYDRHILVEGRDQLSVLYEILQESGNAVFEAGRVQVQGRREARRFWLRWWAEDRVKSGSEAERAEARTLVTELDEADRHREEWKRQASAEVAARLREVDTALTNAVRQLPGIEKRLLGGSDDVWTQVLIEIGNVEVNKEAYRHLTAADLNPLALRALRGALSPDNKVIILHCIKNRKLGAARPELVRLLKDPDAGVRGLSAATLLHLDGLKAFPLTDPLLQDPDAIVRGYVAGQICSEGMIEAAPRLRALMDDPPVRRAIAFGGLRIGIAESTDFLFEEAASRPDYHGRQQALWSLTPRVGPEYNLRMVELLRKEQDPVARDILLRHLGNSGAREAIPEILRLLDNPGNVLPHHFMPQAVEALAKIQGSAAAPALLKLMEREQTWGHAAESLAQMGELKAVPFLRKRLKPEEPGAGFVARTLARLDDAESIPAIRALLEHPEPRIQGGAALALAMLGDRQSIPRILKLFKESEYIPDLDQGQVLLYLPQETVQKELEEMLGRIQYSHCEAWARVGKNRVPELLAMLPNPNRSHSFVLQVLGRVEGDQALLAVRSALAHPDPESRVQAQLLLCRRGLRETLPAIFAADFHGAYSFPPWELNALRAPDLWNRLGERSLEKPLYGSAHHLVKEIAKQAGVFLEELPADSPLRPVWDQYHLGVREWGRPLPLREALERIQHSRWRIVLEADRIRVLSRDDADKLWKSWWEKENR